jgi:hypothetical protein
MKKLLKTLLPIAVEANVKNALLVTTLVLVGCGQGHDAESDLSEPINPRNNVSYVDVARNADLAYDLSEFPTSARVTQAVWTGHWYPASAGGTKAAMMQYDRAFGTNGKAAAWEAAHSAQHAGTPWAGHCNGLAAAGINTPEPRKPVVRNGVTFSVEQVKALLVEAYQGTVSSGRVVGGSCSQPLTTDAHGRPTDDWCRDLNPGSLHLALGNFIGKFGVPVVLDIQNGVQVWNYPAVSYNASINVIDAHEAQRLVTGQSAAYSFNSNAVSFRSVTMTISLINNTQLFLTYVLELDANGKVIGGEWTGSSKINHPDFVWRLTKPSPENPELDVTEILAIAALSY